MTLWLPVAKIFTMITGSWPISFIPIQGDPPIHSVTCMSAPAFYLGYISYRDFFSWFPTIIRNKPNSFPPPPDFEHVNWHDPSPCLHVYKHVTLPYSDLWLCKIINQSHYVAQIPVIYHHGYILIALWRNRNACEICFTVEHQFCQKLNTDHQWSLFPGKYYLIYWQFAPEEITAVIETRGHACDWFVFCHYVLLGTFSSGFIYYQEFNSNHTMDCHLSQRATQLLAILHISGGNLNKPQKSEDKQ